MPDLPGGYLTPFPDTRPWGLRRRSLPAATELWRIDATPPGEWQWAGFPEPRYRFDPASGTFRTRYAGGAWIGAFRERYRSTGLVIPSDHQHHHLVRLKATRNVRVLDLRTEKNLDVLKLDDQISTGQHPDVWTTCHRLVDAVRLWWNDIDAIVYRSRTTPESSFNIAFFGVDGFALTSRTVGDETDILTELVLHHDFTIDWELG